MLFRKPIIDPSVQARVLDYPEAYGYRERIASMRSADVSDESSEKWEKHHKNLMTMLSRFGQVETHHSAHRGFYHTRDRYNGYDDGVAMMNPKVPKHGLLRAIQEQLTSYLDGCLCMLAGDTPLTRRTDANRSIDGLEILVTRNEVLIQWIGCTRDQCIQRIRAAGIQFSEPSS